MRRVVIALVAFGVAVGGAMPAGADGIPASKRCVGNPPRQTEDPMSPPCVPYFEGDNGGATYQGVTADEIRVLVYFDAGSYAGEASPPAGTYVDLDDTYGRPCLATYPLRDPAPCEHILIRATKAFSRYFNERFQTYNRRVRYFAYFSGAATEAARRADAAGNWAAVGPFAVLDEAILNGNNEAYVDEMASHGVLAFATPAALTEAAYLQHPSLVWTFLPDLPHRADLYASYVCGKVAPFKASHTDDQMIKGRPRVFGLYYTSDPTQIALHRLRARVKERLAECGVTWRAEATFPSAGYVVEGGDTGIDQVAAAAKFKASGVTTVLWLGGVETGFSRAAGAQAYHPEIVLAGDGTLEGAWTGRFQDQTVWRNSWAVDYRPRVHRASETAAHAAYLEGDPFASDEDARFGVDLYQDHFLMFLAIQLAGPTLDPAHVDSGLRTRPHDPSDGPSHPACFFETGDYSCVKDAMEVWWDPGARAPEATLPGCMRMVRDGRRSLAGAWEGGDDVFEDRSDPCSGRASAFKIRVR